jgi:hypothetical protein
MDLFVGPTISFRLLYGLLIMGHGRRQILWSDRASNIRLPCEPVLCHVVEEVRAGHPGRRDAHLSGG